MDAVPDRTLGDIVAVMDEETVFRPSGAEQEFPETLDGSSQPETDAASGDSGLAPGYIPGPANAALSSGADAFGDGSGASSPMDRQCPEPEEAPFPDASEAFGLTLDGKDPNEVAFPPRLLGIRLRKRGQVFFFADSEHTVRPGTKVVVSMEQGPSLGEVVSIIHGREFDNSDGEAMAEGTVLGLATAQDIAQHTENSILAAEASAFCKTCIRQRNLDMKLVDVEVLHDRSKIIFFFTAPSRIDFRELVKDLVRNYRTRIELRQIGVRHETQMIGGLGNCGMVCCCHRYLRKFAPVTIKMAKEQNLFLNPAKLSGMCGRLLCCLSFEQSNYEEFNRRCPKIGKKYVTNRGTVKVLRANMFSRSVAIQTENGEELDMPIEEWVSLEPNRAEPPGPEQQRAQVHRGDNRKPYQRREPQQRNADAEPARFDSEQEADKDASSHDRTGEYGGNRPSGPRSPRHRKKLGKR